MLQTFSAKDISPKPSMIFEMLEETEGTENQIYANTYYNISTKLIKK